MNDKKQTVTAIAAGTLAGTAAALILMLLWSFITVKIQSVNYNAFIPISIICLCIGAAAGGFLCARIKKQNGMIFGAVCSAVIFIVMAAIAFISGTQPTVNLLLRLALMLPIGAAGGILGVNKRKKKRR